MGHVRRIAQISLLADRPHDIDIFLTVFHQIIYTAQVLRSFSERLAIQTLNWLVLALQSAVDAIAHSFSMLGIEGTGSPGKRDMMLGFLC